MSRRRLMGRLLGFPFKRVAAGVLAVVVVIAAAVFIRNVSKEDGGNTLRSDTPPFEYLYLDSARVLSYLGQIDEGLSTKEKRVESRKLTTGTALKGGLVADVNAGREREFVREGEVTPTASDRFFRLLLKLRGEKHWLENVDAKVGPSNTVEEIREQFADVREGNFVRIHNAHLFLPRYARLVPKARYVAPTAGARPTGTLYTLKADPDENGGLKTYLTALGENPSLPFTVKTQSLRGVDRQAVTFFIPVRYTDLIENARLFAGDVTIVGKVVYKDPRLPGDKTCETPSPTGRRQCSYFDRETLATFGRALEEAHPSILKRIGMEGLDPAAIVDRVEQSVTFHVPVVVVLPVAIYQ